MPSWITHIATANKLSKKINVSDNDEFLFANVAPDILEGHIIKDVSRIVPYEIAHFAEMVDRNGINVPLPDIKKFKQIYKSNFDNPFILGYYTHLLTDYFWNDYCYGNYFYIYDKTKNIIRVKHFDGSEKIETWHDAVKEKQKDFRIFTIYLQDKIDISNNFNENKILKDSEEFFITEKDITNTINYLKDIKNLKIENGNYTIFNEEMLKNAFDKSIDFIIEKLVEDN